MKNKNKVSVKRRGKKVNTRAKHGFKAPVQGSVQGPDSKGWNRIEPSMVSLSKEIELADDDVLRFYSEDDRA